MNLFVTGATGFIGKNFIKLALKKNNFIYAPTRKKKKLLINKKIKWLFGDFDMGWTKELSKCDLLVHFAADGVNNYYSKNIYEINVFKSLRLLENAIQSGCKKWLIVSTSSEYGKNLNKKKTFSLNHNRIPDSDYGLSKAIFSDQSIALAKKFKCQSRIMRIFPVYGKGENPNRLFPSIIKAIKRKENIRLHNPFEKRDFSHVDFVSNIILDSLNFKKRKFKFFQIWNVADNYPKTVKKFAELIWKKNKAKGKILFKKNAKIFFTHISNKNSLWKI